MNFNGNESNPIMSRIKSQRVISNPNTTPSSNNNLNTITEQVSKMNLTTEMSYTKEQEVTKQPMIYKPPIRSQSTKPNKNNSSSNVTSGSNTSVTSSKDTTMNTLNYTNLNTNTYINSQLTYGKNNPNSNLNSNSYLNMNTNMNYYPENTTDYNMTTYTKEKDMINYNYSNSTYKNQPSNYSASSTVYSGGNFGGSNFHRGLTMDPNYYAGGLSKNPSLKSDNFYGGYNNQNSFQNRPNHIQSSSSVLSSTQSMNNLMNNQNGFSGNVNSSTPVKPTYKSMVNNNYTPTSSYTPQNNCLINLEDLMLLEEKLEEIIYNLNINKPMINECFEWWNFYFNCSLCGKFEFYFKEEIRKNVIRDYSHLELITIIICYDSSYDKELLEKILVILKSILSLLHQNFLIICEYVISKISSDSQTNIWVQKLIALVENKMSLYKANLGEEGLNKYHEFFSSSKTSDAYIAEIKANNSAVYDYLRIILKNYPLQIEITEQLISYFKSISKLNIHILNDFFRTKVIRVFNKNASVLASALIGTEKMEQIPVPYLKKESLKEYTLVLDLDETLIHFKIDMSDENKGLLRLRPGIFEFLDAVSQHYELIIFTAATQDYADPILDAIEQDRLYFDYRLYRQHAIIYDNDFVKDISRLGRDLSKIIIVDNMPQNFRLQKENGIFIRTFYGEDPDDSALLELIPILTKVAQDKVKDVRTALMKFRDEILRRISSNIERQGGNGNKFK